MPNLPPAAATGSRLREEVTPPLILRDLAAGRSPAGSLDLDLIRAAVDHRMIGLLWTWAQDHARGSELRTNLVLGDLRWQGHLRDVESTLVGSIERLEAAGIEVVTMKGLATEARWYDRHGERPCVDVDLLIAPRDVHRMAEAVEVLQPGHPWLGDFEALVGSGRLQAVTLTVGDLELDLHADPLKLGISVRYPERFWSHTEAVVLHGGGVVRALDATAQLVMFLVHMNKDRFQRLLGFADVARIVRSGDVDWDEFRQLVTDEGLEVPVLNSLDVALGELDLPWPAGLPRPPRGPRTLAWRTIWSRRIRLRGAEGRLRYRMRQNWIGVLTRGRGREAAWWWLRDLFPPRVTVRTHYAHIRGPYAWKLLVGRLEAHREQRRRLLSIRES